MSQPSQADVFAALQAQASSSRPKPPSQPFNHFPNPEVDLVTSSTSVNACSIYCPREGCGSKILSPEASTWVIQANQILPDDPASPFSPHRKLSAGYGFWRVAQPFDFDNVGYSRAVATDIGTQAGKKIKWLICAECDLGPLGYGFEGEKEAFVSADRVLYGVTKLA